jgi:hypothetical protein
MFPGRTDKVLRLSLHDPAFRSLCEDLADAHDSLARMAAVPGPTERPEVAEYRAIIAELEGEVRDYIASKFP